MNRNSSGRVKVGLTVVSVVAMIACGAGLAQEKPASRNTEPVGAPGDSLVPEVLGVSSTRGVPATRPADPAPDPEVMADVARMAARRDVVELVAGIPVVPLDVTLPALGGLARLGPLRIDGAFLMGCQDAQLRFGQAETALKDVVSYWLKDGVVVRVFWSKDKAPREVATAFLSECRKAGTLPEGVPERNDFGYTGGERELPRQLGRFSYSVLWEGKVASLQLRYMVDEDLRLPSEARVPPGAATGGVVKIGGLPVAGGPAINDIALAGGVGFPYEKVRLLNQFASVRGRRMPIAECEYQRDEQGGWVATRAVVKRDGAAVTAADLENLYFQLRSEIGIRREYIVDPAVEFLTDGHCRVRLTFDQKGPAELTFASRRLQVEELRAGPAPKAVAAMVRQLSSENVEARRRAIRSLATLDRPETAPALAKALKDPDPRVREYAAVALGALGNPKAGEFDAKALGERWADVAAVLKSDDLVLRPRAVEAMYGTALWGPRSRVALQEAAASSDPVTRGDALRCLVAAAADVATRDLVLKGIADPNRLLSRECFQLLGTLEGVKDKAPLGWLKNKLTDARPSVRLAAARGMRDAYRVDAGGWCPPQNEVPGMVAALKAVQGDPDPAVRAMAKEALEVLAPQAPASRPAS